MANSLAMSSETLFDMNGDATIVVGPAIRGEVWEIEHLSVSTDSGDDLPTEAFIYRESISPSNLLEATTNGNGDVTNTNIRLVAPELLWVQWGPPRGLDGLLLAEKRAMLHIEGKRDF